MYYTKFNRGPNKKPLAGIFCDLDSFNLDLSVVLTVTNLAVTVTLGLVADD